MDAAWSGWAVVRIVWKEPAGPQAFVGAEYDEDGQITPYFTHG
jgi:hypothetical protein